LSVGSLSLTDSARPYPTRPQRLRVIFCTRGGLFGALVLRRLQACERIEVCGIVRSSRMFHPRLNALRGALAYVRRSGIAYALYLLSATTLADVLCRFGPVPCVPTRSRPSCAPVHTTRDINDPTSLKFLRDCAPDLLVSAFFDQRLQEAALAVPSRACVNIHPSLLPYFKGVDPVLQARLQHGKIGVTVHYMSPVLDEGEILAQRSTVPSEHASLFETTATLFDEGAELVVRQIEGLERGDRGTPQESGGSYQSWPSRADVRALRAAGIALMRLADFKRMV
jgi:methionyl-tRNA formyltransferase